MRIHAVCSTSLVLVVISLEAISTAAQISPYFDAGIFLPGSGQTHGLMVDAGLYVSIQKYTAEIEAGTDNGKKTDTHTGYSYRTHALIFRQLSTNWHAGVGAHYEELITSAYKKNSFFPTVAFLRQTNTYRLNIEYLVRSDHRGYDQTGPLFDFKVYLKRGLFYRERVGLLVFRNPYEASPSHHLGASVDMSIGYTFHRKAE